MPPMSDATKHAIDAISVSTIIFTLSQWLPPIAALISIIWGCIRIYETETIQSLLGNRIRFRKRDNTKL
jgi:hypothetical protein